jgi:hypothetical protein
MPNALFGPAMTKPTQNELGEVTFYVSGGDLTEDKTEIYRFNKTNDGEETWTKLELEALPAKSIGFSLLFTYEHKGKIFLVLAGGITKDYKSKSKEVRIIDITTESSFEVRARTLTHKDYFFDNQLVEQPMNLLYSVGYHYLWQYSKERQMFSRFSADNDDLGLEGQLGSSGFIMP